MQPITPSLSEVSATRPKRRWRSGMAVVAAAILLPWGNSAFAATSPPVQPQGIKAFRLCTGSDNLSHVIQGTIDQNAITEVSNLSFKETPPHAKYDWHAAPEAQYVITLSGTLEFSTTGGENFILHPGEVLLAQDTTGPGHRWRLIDDQPWRRAYIVLKADEDKAFVPKEGSTNKDGCPA